ncbi:M61 family metallopeptidase [Algoriphagus sp. AK58]|uniref:M61 family metallopeptidase n=1 Tax=Algoriphagus sp. AK58 TaxID=1406877 RepID=UPI00164FEE64|nr:M61 family metallopeptidase [Algoriphagus sp. AK58]MBC6368948.1 peptidase [Algoriphagus sp. AK58]
MIYYKISCPIPTSQFLAIQFQVENPGETKLELQLPAWRAGRYQLANYAQNIRALKAWDKNQRILPLTKISKDRWTIDGQGQITVSYEYWAGKMDAGSAWADDQQVYFNLVNCCFEVIGQEQSPVEVRLDLPEFPVKMSTLRPNGKDVWIADNFEMLADSTILASKGLTNWNYQAGETVFQIWIQGEVHFEKDLFIKRFQDFSEKLIRDFGEFPEPEYHFIFQLLTYPHYHGVEHRKGTVITFGPAEKLTDAAEMEELLGISCHELYHAWNVCRIRPKELLPYDFSKEIYTKAGLILEGVTTYMGDLYLLKSGVYDLPTYLRHFEKLINREANSFGWKNHSILESSFDLWLDGYQPGIPDRKVNIYTHGALLNFCLDIMLLENGSSLSKVMRLMWERFGKPMDGYTLEHFKSIIQKESKMPNQIQEFFCRYVEGNEDVFQVLEEKLGILGLELTKTWSDDFLLHQFGVRTTPQRLITQIHPESSALQFLMIGDEVLNSEMLHPESIRIQVNRNGRLLGLTISKEKQPFFPIYQIAVKKESSLQIAWRT